MRTVDYEHLARLARTPRNVDVNDYGYMWSTHFWPWNLAFYTFVLTGVTSPVLTVLAVFKVIPWIWVAYLVAAVIISLVLIKLLEPIAERHGNGDYLNNLNFTFGGLIQANKGTLNEGKVGMGVMVFSTDPRKATDPLWAQKMAHKMSNIRHNGAKTEDERYIKKCLDGERNSTKEQQLSPSIAGDQTTFWRAIELLPYNFPEEIMGNSFPDLIAIPYFFEFIDHDPMRPRIIDMVPKKLWFKSL